jgi:hypothetical protein
MNQVRLGQHETAGQSEVLAHACPFIVRVHTVTGATQCGRPRVSR